MYLKRIEKLFTDVISHNIEEKDSKLFVRLKLSSEWNDTAAMAFQTLILDRNPLAYGAPFNFLCEQKNENYIVTWNCYNVCG